MPWLTMYRRQKGQLFEDQRKAKTHCFRARESQERLRELQKAFLRHLARRTPGSPKSSGFGVILYWLRQRV